MSLLERYTQPAESQIPTVSHHGEIPSGQPVCQITIDGQEVTAVVGESILRAAQRAGFNVPTLCDDEKLAPAAACRMCLVEIEGYDRPMPSCHLPAEAGMKVTATSDGLFDMRKQNLEYILSDHNAYCMPPCQVGCPTHIDIPGYLELMAKGQHVEAARLVKEVLPFPYALGLVCPAPCQEVCRRGLVEEEIAIRQCHGYGGELSLEMEVAPTPFPQEVATGKKVAVIGAGPAGLTCAYYAALKGHAVTVFDMMEKQGGMLRYGIPEYRLPKVKLDKELNSVWQLRDTEFKGGKKLGRDFTIDDLFAQGYDAIFLGIGAWTSNELRIPGEDLPGVIEAISYLRQNASGDPVPVGQGNKVVVLGGGFTTFDCARTSRRLGADVTVVYRRGRKEMGAHYTEVDDAEHEGIKLEFFAAPVRIVEKNGRVGGVEFQRMALGEADASGRRRPVPVEGSEFIIECDTVIPAIGQSPVLDWMETTPGIRKTRRETVIASGALMTDRPGVFAGGDAQMGPVTVIQCVAQGKLAAKAMDRYLAGDDMAVVADELRAEEEVPELIDIVPYKPEEPQVRMPFLPFTDRVKSFELIEKGYDKAGAEKEAARCLQCVCPDAGRCHLQRLSLEHGLTENKFHRGEPVEYHDYEYDFSHDFILRDLNKCINCTQCVRICRDVIGANCYGLMGAGYDSIVTTPWNVSLSYTDCVSCGACAETCPTGALMMRERDLQTYELDVVRCIYCGDCVEVCPHGALGETPNFELSTYQRFGVTVLAKEELAAARNWKPSEHIPLADESQRNAIRPPEIRPPGPPRWNA
jgi:NADPH-dependent glutamate synthase beta subunit-like oxidoreductase/formate hydrogenlyase subunit 6/NADH:ubiquinone oxidoreductase subunit I/ferredoxin